MRDPIPFSFPIFSFDFGEFPLWRLFFCNYLGTFQGSRLLQVLAANLRPGSAAPVLLPMRSDPKPRSTLPRAPRGKRQVMCTGACKFILHVWFAQELMTVAVAGRSAHGVPAWQRRRPAWQRLGR